MLFTNDYDDHENGKEICEKHRTYRVMRNAYKFLNEEPKTKMSFGRIKRRWKGNIT
jgi:hypothetical protein